ncbi:MAG: DUF3592 domain-containing protein [Leptolyngbya sp. DLM2.Bin27]|nr:MAG: DUF3592 domain-containing protein [Leptolyngbya sp. DLM2.Bin27]
MNVFLWTAPVSTFFSTFILLGVFLVLLGVLLIFGVFGQANLGESIGVVLSTDVISQSDIDDNIYYEALVKYSYRVGGYCYEGERVIASCKEKKEAIKHLKSYRKGRHLALLYDLKNNNLSRFNHVKDDIGAFTLINVGLMFVVGGYVLGKVMTGRPWPDAPFEDVPLPHPEGVTWGYVGALFLASCLHGWGAFSQVNPSEKMAMTCFQHAPVLFGIWRSPVFRRLNGLLAGIYFIAALALVIL